MGLSCITTAFCHSLMKCMCLISGISQVFAAFIACLTFRCLEIYRVIMWNLNHQYLLDTNLCVPSN